MFQVKQMNIKESIMVPTAHWMKAVAGARDKLEQDGKSLGFAMVVRVFVLTRLPFNLFLAQVASQEG